jgi:hypothetical protein
LDVLRCPLFQEEIVRNRNGSFYSGLVIGVAAGLMAGIIGVAHSATGKKAWDRFGGMFQAGYIAGFLDCVRLAKGTDPRGYIATNYILPSAARAGDYQRWIAEEYKKPESAARTLPQMLVLASHAMEAKFGPETPMGNVQMQQMRRIIDLRRQAIGEDAKEKKAAEEGDTAKPEEGAGAAETEPSPKARSGGNAAEK